MLESVQYILLTKEREVFQMRIERLVIENFRNLENIEFIFDLKANIIVGRNNTGKSNLLHLINTLCYRKWFDITDFTNENKPIQIDLRLAIEPIELGIFNDLFDEENINNIDLRIIQESPSEPLKMTEKHSEINVPIDKLRLLNVVHYSSEKYVGADLILASNRRPNRVFTRILERYIEEHDLSVVKLVNEEGFSNLVNHVNSILSRIKPFKDTEIFATSQPDLLDISTRAIILQEPGGSPIENSGSGIQYLIRIPLSILSTIDSIMNSKTQKSIIERPSGEKEFSFVYCLDEPEIHLHPFMQRSLINYLRDISLGKDKDFNSLIKEIFDIDVIQGQLFIVTHSPFIIGEDYHEITKLYSTKEGQNCISGVTVDLEEKINKHLKLRFPLIKEAMFSRSVIAIEGETEECCIKMWGDRLNLNFDNLEIAVIRCQGSSVPQVLTVLQKFGVNACGLLDRDKSHVPDPLINLSVTNKRDFEEEIVDVLIDNNRYDILKEIISHHDNRRKIYVQKTSIQKIVERYDLNRIYSASDLIMNDLDYSDLQQLKVFFLTWLDNNKSLELGQLIGELLPTELIPTVYSDLIEMAANRTKWS